MNAELDFKTRSQLSEPVIITAKAIVRALQGEPIKESEKELAALMVAFRNSLVSITDSVKMDLGPGVTIEGESVKAYQWFIHGFIAAKRAYQETQEARCFDLDWSEARQKVSSFREAIEHLLHFNAIAYAHEQGCTVQIAKQKLQLQRDLKQIECSAYVEPQSTNTATDDTESGDTGNEDSAGDAESDANRRYYIGQIVHEHCSRPKPSKWPSIADAVEKKGFGKISSSTLERYMKYYCEEIGFELPPPRPSGRPKKNTDAAK